MKLLFYILKSTWLFTQLPVIGRIWWKLYGRISKCADPVRIKIHGYHCIMPMNYTYWITARLYKNYNNPLVEAVYQAYKLKGGKVNVVDIGAAIGDTALLLMANCREMINWIRCVEGDKEFYRYLTENTGHIKEIRRDLQELSSSRELIKSLVKIHGGTASSQGESKTSALPFDDLFIENIDIIKIDCDGYDGKILVGAIETIKKYKPIIVFEWYPELYKKVAHDDRMPDRIVKDFGYNIFIPFNKYGNYGEDTEYLDIVAIPDKSNAIINDITACNFAKQRRSKY
ncbi:MAG TPA: FkbM family methyltransferase [Puia sp.]|nr:FkbM family methyltransferase [Puia sp.]